MKTAAAVLFVVLVAMAVYADQAAAEADDGQDGDEGEGGAFGFGLDFLFADPLGLEPVSINANANRAAFLAVIRRAETGTAGPRSYTTLVGGAQFADLSRHPNIYNRALNSTAAGAYQFLHATWEEARRALGLPDFSPASQDAAALWLIDRRGALPAIDRGDFAGAVQACRREWASLPGAGYGQPETSLTTLQSWFLASGGAIA